MDGKAALITGAASGIGAATLRLFVAMGAKVLLTDIMGELGAALADELGSDAHYLHVDVTKESQVEKAVQYCVDEWGKLNVIFINASTAVIRTSSGPHIYSACKVAVIQLTRTVASEPGKYGVRVNCVCLEASSPRSIFVA